MALTGQLGIPDSQLAQVQLAPGAPVVEHVASLIASLDPLTVVSAGVVAFPALGSLTQTLAPLTVVATAHLVPLIILAPVDPLAVTDPAALAAAIVGTGVHLTGTPTFTGDPRAVGTFTGGDTAIVGFPPLFTPPWYPFPPRIDGTMIGGSLGSGALPALTHGVFLSNGRAVDAMGPNWTGGISTDFGPPLSAAGDTATLTFQVIADYDTLRIEICFGSDEWTEYCCDPDNFNDGVFIYINGENIALIPGTSTPINANTVFPPFVVDAVGSHAEYYATGDVGPASDFQYDGFCLFGYTVPVVPGATYTIVIQVIDVGQGEGTLLNPGAVDSGVFVGTISSAPLGITGSLTATLPLTLVARGTVRTPPVETAIGGGACQADVPSPPVGGHACQADRLHEPARRQRQLPAPAPSIVTELTITTTNDPVALATAACGSGVHLTGTPVFTGDPSQGGTYVGGDQNPLGGFVMTSMLYVVSGPLPQLASGVILSSGKVSDAPGPNTSETSTIFDTPEAPYGDEATLTFSVIPDHATLHIEIAFCSDEWTEYMHPDPALGFNDWFTLSVDGTNIALVPGTSDPINCGTVYPPILDPVGSHAEYWTDLLGDPADGQTNYDGAALFFFDVPVTPGVAHTIEILIADTGHTGFELHPGAIDSAVFVGLITSPDPGGGTGPGPDPPLGGGSCQAPLLP